MGKKIVYSREISLSHKQFGKKNLMECGQWRAIIQKSYVKISSFIKVRQFYLSKKIMTFWKSEKLKRDYLRPLH